LQRLSVGADFHLWSHTVSVAGISDRRKQR
jgi:hypothetical protein